MIGYTNSIFKVYCPLVCKVTHFPYFIIADARLHIPVYIFITGEANQFSRIKLSNKRENLFKQFVVTNCSKERLGSIVTETLKKRNFETNSYIKELHFNANFKYISFIKFSLSHQKLRA